MFSVRYIRWVLENGVFNMDMWSVWDLSSVVYQLTTPSSCDSLPW